MANEQQDTGHGPAEQEAKPTALTYEQRRELGAIFHPHSNEQMEKLKGNGGRLIHYTTAAGAKGIIEGRSVWMRNARAMHDYSESEHGHQMLRECLSDEKRREHFRLAFNGSHSGLAEEILSVYDTALPAAILATSIACFSEHLPQDDMHGRLSMWRAFGQNTPSVGFVVRPPLDGQAANLGVILSPVAYFDFPRFCAEFGRAMDSLIAHRDRLAATDRAIVKDFGVMMLLTTIFSLKHPGFEEEREWRAIYNPALFHSKHVPQSLVVHQQLPQVVHRLVFEDVPEAGISGMTLAAVIDRLIIGPTQYASVVSEAMYKLLEGAGVPDLDKKLVISRIPLRG
ncbi:DUF2971 domain-containing protein [Pandoraea commovens]|uniref:DUF2971 domain-containing protein n=1 Tax=Pandoraea commovens TaxID=2508289 RepID=A0ABY5QL22_9BURK|nr:DUF2971 domain-containing protein [Pandoraea commovens]UVA80528.1 hypothetical protein NTU39_05770 [Pandoraea commovens]